MKSIDLKDISYWIANAWDKVGEKTFAKSWDKLLGKDESPDEETTDQVAQNILPLVALIPGCEGASFGDVED